MTELESIISATCITNVVKIEEGFDFDGKSYRLFLTPASEESKVKVGDVVIVSGILQYSDGDFVDVPVVVGNWSPVLFKEVKFDESLEGLDAYVAPLKYYQVL